MMQLPGTNCVRIGGVYNARVEMQIVRNHCTEPLFCLASVCDPTALNICYPWRYPWRLTNVSVRRFRPIARGATICGRCIEVVKQESPAQ